MKIKQYAYFRIRSDRLPPAEITTHVGIAPDRVALRGSRIKDPPRPATHVWEVRCDEHGLTVTEQIERVIDRLGPRRDAIRVLVESAHDITTCLQVVREFDGDDGEEEVLPSIGDLQKLSGQHQLLGWHLSVEVLDFLRGVQAEIDVDEYG